MTFPTTRLRRGVVMCVGLGIAASGCRTAGPTSFSPNAPSAISETTAKSAQGSRPEIIPASSTEPIGATNGAKPLEANTANSREIDLEFALTRAGIDNPTIGLARERIRESLAMQMAARSLLLPSLTAGANLHIHRGNLQRSSGSIISVDSQSLYFGAGARTLAAESVAIPGVRLFAHLGDAIMEPRAAQQRVTVRSAEALAIQNQTLLVVAITYLELIGADARVGVLKRGEAELGEIVRLTTEYAKAGQGREADAQRAKVNFDLIQRQRQDAEGDLAAASARLAGLLNLDPSTRLSPIPGPLAPVTLLDDSGELETYINQSFANRPERLARNAEVNEAQVRVRQERVRPWLPTLSVGLSSGGFGGGSDRVPYQFDHFDARTDFDVLAVWSVQNLGFGNRALQRQTTARVGQATAELIRTENDIRQETSEALAAAQAAKAQIEVAGKSVKAAEDGAAEEMTRIKAVVGRPLEALDSARQLIDARLELVRALTEYNIAQFRLWVAVGITPVAGPTSAPLPLPVRP